MDHQVKKKQTRTKIQKQLSYAVTSWGLEIWDI